MTEHIMMFIRFGAGNEVFVAIGTLPLRHNTTQHEQIVFRRRYDNVVVLSRGAMRLGFPSVPQGHITLGTLCRPRCGDVCVPDIVDWFTDRFAIHSILPFTAPTLFSASHQRNIIYPQEICQQLLGVHRAFTRINIGDIGDIQTQRMYVTTRRS
jgi:hypothetical protein